MQASARFQITAIFAGYGVAGLFWGCLAASSPAIQARAGLDAAGFGLMLGVMALAAFPVMRMLGARLHRVERYAIPACLVSFMLATTIVGWADSRLALLVGFALAGATSGALDISLNNRVARIEADTGARLFNRCHAFFPAVSLAASASTGVMRGADVPLGVIFTAIALSFAIVAVVEWRAGGHMQPVVVPVTDQPAPRVLKGALILLAIIAAMGAFQEAAAQGWAAIFVENVREAGPVLAGFAPAAYTLGLSAGRLMAHAVETRLRPLATLRIAALIALPCFLLIAMGAPIWAVLIAFFLAGCGVGPIEPAIFRAVATRADPAARGRALAAVTGIAYMGYLVSPPLLGLVAQGLGWPALWILTALGSAVVLGIARVLPPARL